MALIAIVFGVLLTLVGTGFCGGVYASSEKFQVTALIPAFFGLPILILGIVARNEKARMHAMHGAALLGLVGFGIPAYFVIKGLITGAEFGLALQESAIMAVICLVFIGLCVKSFIDARIARKQKEAESQSSTPSV